MSEIYKINRVINKEISHIYVFSGDKNITEKEYPDIFSTGELKNIRDKKIPIQIIKSFIHGDDTIQRIKEKIFMDCKNLNNAIPTELYLFSITERKLNNYNTFLNLTQQDRIDLTDERLKQFLSNFVINKDKILYKELSSFFDDIVKQDIYEFDDFNTLDINWDNDQIFTESIGQKLVIKNNYPFIANPFNNNIIDSFLKRSVENIISTQNAYLLFKYFPLVNNNIYLCLAEDVLSYTETNELDSEYFLKLYFPILYKTVKTKKQLQDKKMLLYRQEKDRISKYHQKINDRVDIFYKVFEQNPTPLDFASHGLSYVHLILHPENSIKLPLEVLFKIMHTNAKIPLIKYNPGSNYENIYRLFTDKNISLSGIKIPSLFILNNYRKGVITNISNTLSKKQSVGFYIEHSFKESVIEIFCEFHENGSIDIKFNSEILLDIDDVENILENAVNNTILKTIRNYLKQSGYEYINFNKITDKNVEVSSLTYKTKLKNNKKININKYIGCISSLFNVIEGKASKTTDVIDLRFKRVNVFQVMDSIKSFITVRRQNDDGVKEILDLLLENFPNEITTEEKAREVFADWLQEIQLRIDTYGERKRIVDSNPGFQTKILSNVFSEGTFSVFTIENINDIRYLRYILIYINSFFRIILRKGINKELKEQIDKICKKKIKQQELVDVVQDIQAETEKRGAVKFGQKEAELLDIEEDSDSDELSIEEDSEEDNEEDSEEDSEEESEEDIDEDIHFGDDMIDDESILTNKERTQSKSVIPQVVEPEEDVESEEEEVVESEEEEVVEPEEDVESEEEEVVESEEEEDLSLIPEEDEEDLSLIPEDEISGSEQESEESEESDDDAVFGDEELGGGGKGNESDDEDDMEEDLSHLAISGAKSIFSKRLKENDPDLFLKKDTPGYHSYSRGCPGQSKRQPVLITDEEKKYIDEKDKELGISSYGESIRYGSGDKKSNYICPRYWCIRDKNGKGRSLTLEQINKGECGGWDAIIPEKAKKVPKGKRIVQFTDERFHREKSGIPEGDPARKLVYRPMYPGFQSPSKHPEGLCIPCCFQTPFKDEPNMGWEKDKAIPFMFKKIGSELPEVPMKSDGTLDLAQLKNKRFDKFRQIKPKAANLLCDEDIEGKVGKSKKNKKTKEFEDTPIMSFPLRKNQFGYMNLSLQKFLGFNNSVCYTKNTESNVDKKLKQQEYCILRLGIMKNKNQSFLELLASVYNYYSGIKILPNELNDLTLTDFKKIFIKNLTIDKFVTVQNGILPTLFHKETIDVNLEDYTSSIYFGKITDISYKEQIARAFENFKQYIKNEDAEIDYSYIWDFVTEPMDKGGLLFKNGINILILRHPDDDIVDKIELICPTNHYSSNFFDFDKKTLMIYNKGGYFEPLCKIYKKSRKFETVKFFSFPRDYNVFKEHSDILDIITKIKEIIDRNCIGKKSIKKYDYERNVSSTDLINLLKENDYNVISQILNYDNKVIGILTQLEDNQFYVPCRPSGVILDINFVFFQDVEIRSYTETSEFLKTLYNKSNKQIPCNIHSKLVDDNMVVGIKTITNQIIPVIPVPKMDVTDDINEERTYVGENKTVLQTDKTVLLEKTVDVEREKIVKELELENNFYGLFRNTLKIILNKKDTNTHRTNILNIVESPTITYIEKLETVMGILHTLLDNSIQFMQFPMDDLDGYKDMITCFGMNETDCGEKWKPPNKQCSFMRKSCALILPSTNLYTKNKNNEDIYFMKLSDEIVRYSKIRKYLFTPREFLSFERVNYKINDDEIILLEEILFDTYLDDIKLRKNDTFIESTNVYDIVNPNDKINYSNTIPENMLRGKEVDSEKTNESKESNLIVDCVAENKYKKKNLIALSNNKTTFQVSPYKSTSICGFQMVQFIINDYMGKKITIDEIKEMLGKVYLELKMPSTQLSLNKSNVSDWSVFSYINWMNKNRNVAEYIISKQSSDKNSEIIKEIKKDTYIMTEIDLFLLLKSHNIPTIIKMKTGQTSLLNSTISTFNTFNESDDKLYIILSTKTNIKKPNRLFGLLNIENVYKIPKQIVNKELLLGFKGKKPTKDINKFIHESLSYQVKKKNEKRDQDAKAQRKVRKKINKMKIKRKLPTAE